MSERSPDKEPELELINQLLASADGDSIPDSIISQLSPEELEEFRQAQECLALLQFAAPAIGAGAVADISTAKEDDSTDRGNSPSSLMTPVEVPKRLGRFEILRELGRGGFGIVLLGRDPGLDRLVALKIPRTESLLFSDSARRFDREARAAAVLGHPAIIPIFESGRIGPLTYIAFEFCDGKTLSEWLASRDGPVEPELAAKIVLRLADAVQHAHSKSVIHRDLKPANIMLAGLHEFEKSADNSRLIEALRITDFGLARMESDDESLTREGAVIGTPAYMAPEQAISDSSAGSPADIYSTGVILFELLTGKVPFTGRTNVEVINALTGTDAPSPRKINPDVPRDLSAICLKCLAKKPEQRYSSSRELCADLENFLEGRPVSAREATTYETAIRWCQRNPLLSGTLAALIAVLAISTAVMTYLWLNADDARRTAEFHETESGRRAEQSVRYSQRLRAAIDSLLTAIANEPALKSKDMEAFRAELLSSATGLYKELRADVPEDEQLLAEYLETMLSLANVLLRLDDHEAVTEICDEAIVTLDQSEIGNPVLKSRFLNVRAQSLSTTGNYAQSLASRQHAIQLQRDLVELHPELEAIKMNLAAELNKAALTALSNSDFVQCREFIGEAIEVLAPVSGADPLQWTATTAHFEVISTNSRLLTDTGQPQEGKQWALRALEMFEEVLGEVSHTDSATLNRLASLHFSIGVTGSVSGDYELAAHHYDSAIEVLKVLCDRHSDVGKYHQDLISKQYSRALIHYFEQEYEQALQLINENIERAETGAVNFPGRSRYFKIDLANTLNLKYGVYDAQDDYEGAKGALLDAIAVAESIIAAGEPGIKVETILGNFHANLGFLESKAGKTEEALLNNSNALEILLPIVARQPRGEALTFSLNACFGAMTACDILEDFEQALTYSEQYVELAPPNDPRAIKAKRAQVYWLASAEEYEDSLALIEELDDAGSGEHLFVLAKSAAKSIGCVETASLPPNVHEQIRRQFVDHCVDLLVRYLEQDQENRQPASAVFEDAAFDPIREDAAYVDLVNAHPDDSPLD
ncbi:MAG: serine/threonine-protein kinase [Planctomycetota bacterium]